MQTLAKIIPEEVNKPVEKGCALILDWKWWAICIGLSVIIGIITCVFHGWTWDNFAYAFIVSFIGICIASWLAAKYLKVQK